MILEKFRKIIAIILLLFSINPILKANENWGMSKFSYGVAEYKSTSELMERAVKISSLTKKDNGHGYALLQSDYHYISDITLEKLSSRLIDLDSASLVFDRIIYSKDLSSDNSIKYPHLQEVHTSYKFLGMGNEYRYKVRVYFDKNTETEFAMRWELYDPMDSTGLYEVCGSWYLKNLVIDGKTLTYIRSYGITLLENPSMGVLFFTRHFGEYEIYRTFRNLLEYE